MGSYTYTETPNLGTLKVKMKAACTSEMSTTLPTSARFNNPKMELLSNEECLSIDAHVLKFKRH
jgi:hypothetical protein